MRPWSTGDRDAALARAPDPPLPGAMIDQLPLRMLASPLTLPIELWDMITPVIC